MVKPLGNKPFFSLKPSLHLGKPTALRLVERWALRVLFVLGVFTTLGSLLLTMRHVRSTMEEAQPFETSPTNPEIQASVFRAQEKKLGLESLLNEDLTSPF